MLKSFIRIIILSASMWLFVILAAPVLAQDREPVDIDFSGPLAKKWYIEKGGEKFYQIGQRTAIEGKKVFPVAIYGGVPFIPLPLTVDGELKNPITIKIISCQRGLLLPTQDSPTPLLEKFDPDTNKKESKFFTHAVNMTWEFTKPGISFEADDTTYVSEKAGAIISFTKEGIKMGGIKKIPTRKILKEQSFEMFLPEGWTRTREVPQGCEIGFRKQLINGQQATLFMHYEIMPSELDKPPDDTSAIQTQFDRMIRNSFPDANPVTTPTVQVNGTIILNKMYDLTDSEIKVRRRYTYFWADHTAFVVQCTTPPTLWKKAVDDFNCMLLTLKPRAGAPQEKITDEVAILRLKTDLPTLVGSFPPQWTCKVTNVKIVRLASQVPGGTLEINLSFERVDIARIYKAVKIIFNMMKEGKTSDEDFQNIPDDVKAVSAADGSGFSEYVGQVWGCAWGYVANCEQPIGRFQIVVLDSKRRRIGAVSISREDGAAILEGKVSASDQQRVARMHQFE